MKNVAARQHQKRVKGTSNDISSLSNGPISTKLQRNVPVAVLFEIVQRFNALLKMSFTDKPFHMHFNPTLDQVFTFTSSSICFYTITQVIDLGPSWPTCLKFLFCPAHHFVISCLYCIQLKCRFEHCISRALRKD